MKAIRNAVVYGTPLILYEVTLNVYPAVPFGFWSKVTGPRQQAALNGGFKPVVDLQMNRLCCRCIQFYQCFSGGTHQYAVFNVAMS